MKEKEKALVWCERQLGYVPKEEEWIAVGVEDPGLLRLFVHVFNKSIADRNIKKEKYEYSKKPSAKMMNDDKLIKSAWKKD